MMFKASKRVDYYSRVTVKVLLRIEIACRTIKGELSVQVRILKTSPCIFLSKSVFCSTAKFTLFTVRPIRST